MDTVHYEGRAQVAEVTAVVVLYFLQLNRVDAAEKIAEEALKGNPGFAVLHLLLANVHVRKRDYSALFRDLDTFLKLEPKGPTSDQVHRTREKFQRALANTPHLFESPGESLVRWPLPRGFLSSRCVTQLAEAILRAGRALVQNGAPKGETLEAHRNGSINELHPRIRRRSAACGHTGAPRLRLSEVPAHH